MWRGGREAVMGDGVRRESGCEGMGSGRAWQVGIPE